MCIMESKFKGKIIISPAVHITFYLYEKHMKRRHVVEKIVLLLLYFWPPTHI